MVGRRQVMRSRARRRGTPVSAVLAIAIVVAGCSSGEAKAPTAMPKVTEIRVAFSPLGSTLPVHVADQKGIFERNGLRVKRTEGESLPVFAAALAHGQYDIVLSVPTLVLVGDSRGLDLQVVSRLQRSSAAEPNSVWVTKDRSIESLAQLKGKTIGVPALTGVITDSLVYLLQRSGVGRKEVKLMQLPFASMGDHLKAGRVDAVVSAIPFNTGLAARGFRIHEDIIVRAVTDASGGKIDTGMTALFASSPTFARENPDAIRAWRKSLNEAIDYLETNDAEARMLLQTWLKMPPEVAQSAPLPSWEVEIMPRDLQPYVEISKTVGSIKREPDVNALVWQDGP